MRPTYNSLSSNPSILLITFLFQLHVFLSIKISESTIAASMCIYRRPPTWAWVAYVRPSLKITDSPCTSKDQLPITRQLWAECHDRPTSPCLLGHFADLTFCYSSCVLLCAKIPPCLKHSFVDSSTSSGSNNLSAIHTCCPLSLGGVWYSQTLGSALYSILFSVQWPIVRLCTDRHHNREKLLWLLLTDALTYECTNKYLGGILILRPLSKTIAVGSCLFLNILIKQTFRPIFAYCVFYLKTYVKLLIYAAAF